MSLNRVQLIGRLGKDPEVRSAGNSDVCNFSVATEERWKDKRTGEWTSKSDWHNVTVWNEGTIKYLDNNVRKGDLVFVEGKLETRKWQDKDGNDRYTTEVVVKPFNGSVEKLNWEKKDGDDDRGSRGRDRDDDRGSRSRDDDRGSRSSRSRDDDRSRSRDDRGGRVQSGRDSRRATADAIDDDIPF